MLKNLPNVIPSHSIVTHCIRYAQPGSVFRGNSNINIEIYIFISLVCSRGNPYLVILEILCFVLILYQFTLSYFTVPVSTITKSHFSPKLHKLD